MVVAIAIILLVVGSILFHFLSPWYFTPLASNWELIDFTVDITFVVTGVVFVATNLFMAYCIIRYRHRKGHRADYNPEDTKLESWLTIITTLGVAAMLAPGLAVWGDFVTVPDDAAEFEAVGQQWHWTYRFPGEDQQFGNVDIRHITEDNAFGMDPEDPAGQDDVLVESPIVHLPVNQPIRAWLRSKDVLHDFAVPQFRVKMDLVPGHVSYTWFTPTVVGEYEVLCEELCGMAHFAMRGRVVVDEPDDFDAWLEEQPTYAELLAQGPGDPSLGQASYGLCAACHGPQGGGMQALNAPRIAGLNKRYVERQLGYYRDGVRGTHELDTAGAMMRPILAALPNEAAIRNVAAYIETLVPETPPANVSGDIERGAELYANCLSCHGENGQGIWTMNAPALAGQHDWYIAAQLRNFREGIRGSHRMDLYGDQMMMLADALPDEKDVNDIIAYLNTL